MAKMTFEQFKSELDTMEEEAALAALRRMDPQERDKATQWLRTDLFTFSDEIRRQGNPLPRPSDGKGYRMPDQG